MASARSFLERYQQGQGFLHRADSRVKLILTLGFIFSVTATPPWAWPVFLFFAALEWTLIVSSRLSVIGTLKRSLLAAPFMLIAAPTVFTKPGTELFTIPVFSWTWVATDEGTVFFLSVLAKSWISVIAAGTLAAVTPFSDLAKAMRHLHIPRILVAIVSFMYRYLFVLVDETLRLMRAREARSAKIGRKAGGPLLWRWRVAGHMVGSLFLRTYERSERIYMAMVSRGYNGEVIIMRQRPLSFPEQALILTVFVVFAAVEVLAAIVW
ncbi:cobalt ECF transporter T component CbiQ [Chloroflexota bacterium]